MLRCLCALAPLAAFNACAAAPKPMPPVDHVVIVIVDGLRPDAIAAARAPHLQRLMKEGPATASARVVEVPETLTGFMTMVTGLPRSKHAVTWNSDLGRTYAGETIYSRVHDAGGRTGLYIGKSKISMIAPRGSADVLRSVDPRDRDSSSSPALAARFAQEFARERFSLALVHFRETDAAGHDSGWMSAPYLDAVRVVDQALGTVLEAIDSSTLAGRTAVLLTTEHGGEGTNHGVGRGDTSWVIPFACRVPGAPGGGIAGPVSLLDLAPTVLALLQLPPLPGMEGRALPECLPR